MTTTKLPPDMVLATPIGGKDNEAKAVIKYLEDQIDDLANVFLDPSKEFNAKPIQFDTTEYD